MKTITSLIFALLAFVSMHYNHVTGVDIVDEQYYDDDSLSELFDLYQNPVRINQTQFLFQGDIRIPHGNNGTSHRDLATIPYNERLWTNDMRNGYYFIPVRISNSYSQETKDLIVKSLRNLQWRSQVIRFRILFRKPANNVPYIHFVNGNDGCWSWIGQNLHEALKPQGQIIMFEENRCARMVTIQHEMMHALGFGHEQSRPDRNQYVKIIWNNVQDNMKDQFKIVDEANSLGTEYDFDSIMHYPLDAWSKNDEPTLEALNNQEIGNRLNASWTDIIQIRLMYQCKSGPRHLDDYEAQKCSEDCQCWHNEPGCGDKDSFCNDDMVCQDNICIKPSDRKDERTKSNTELVTGDMKELKSDEYYFVPGAMFDIQAKGNPIKITNLYYQGVQGDVWVDIYTKQWTHFNWAGKEGKWELIGSAFLRVAPNDTPTLLPFNTFRPILLQKWHRRGFYIQTRDCGTDCNKLRVWLGENYAVNAEPFIENEDVRILEGCALKGKFDNSGQRCKQERGGESFTFWGGVKYVVRPEII